MDLVGACSAFVYVSERGSFTLGAAAARIPQPVASRRIAALERHLGGRLFDRSTRRAALTPFGRDLLPSARRLIALAEAMEHDAERARLAPLRLAVPDVCGTRELALLGAAALRRGIHLDLHPAPPSERDDLLRTRQVRACTAAVPADAAVWTVPLGLAARAEPRAAAVHLETLRTGRGDVEERRRVWIQPEDDVPHVRDRVRRLGASVGLAPAQIAVAPAYTAAAAQVLDSADLLLCSAVQAGELGLHWRPAGGIDPVRGYAVAAADGGDAERIERGLGDGLARCLGAAGDEAGTDAGGAGVRG
ncbi:LysR family transcriptional regulator [Streptomonospora salina]|uniref:DNA-binding transcriptional LysR family regulator n=1 Tax=Streptomonospora salina TaxID=104205 RepID=A0A841EEK9_9ACTN|nr:LysR family transcriptional regulator [Streptomonospora salina]MBB5999769.1 DNA-binding transcriptional LysR family regulator [Streptomonospora salina]